MALTGGYTGGIAGYLAGSLAGASVVVVPVELTSGLLSNRQLTFMRSAVTRSLASVGAVYRATYAGIDGRTVTSGYAVVIASTRLRVQKPQSQNAGKFGEQDAPDHDRIIVFPFASDVRPGDVVKVGSDVWEVISGDGDRTDALCLSCKVVADVMSRGGMLA